MKELRETDKDLLMLMDAVNMLDYAYCCVHYKPSDYRRLQDLRDRIRTAYNDFLLKEGKIMLVHLFLKYRWFDMVASGVKIEEYREIKPYYKKLANLRKGDMIMFHRGYTNTCMGAKVRYCYQSFGVPSWGGDPDKLQWVIGFEIIYKGI